jgi:hypothetical protein
VYLAQSASTKAQTASTKTQTASAKTQTVSTKADISRLQDNKNDFIKLEGSIDLNSFSISSTNDTKAYCKGTYTYMYTYQYLYT